MRRILFVLLPLLAILVSCQDDDAGRATNTVEKEVEIEIKGDWISTRSPIELENRIGSLDILVFQGMGDNAQFLYRRYAFRNNNSANAYRATLKTGENLTLYFAANAKDFLDGIDLLEDGSGATWSEVNKKLVLNNPTNINAKELPMWGMLTPVKIEDKPVINLGRVELLRTVSSADFELTTAAAKQFDLKAVYLVYAADKGYLPYDPNVTFQNSSGTLFAYEPYVPVGMNTTIDWPYPVNGANTVNNIFYMFDNDAKLPAVDPKYQTKLVMEGKWKDSRGSQEDTFYPVAFREYDKGSGVGEKLQVTRNYKYMITVTGINGDGFRTLDEAKKGEEINVNYEVIPWEETEDEELIVEGNQYVSIARKYASMQRGSGTRDEIGMSTSYTMEDIIMSKTKDFTGGHIKTLLLDAHNASAGDEPFCAVNLSQDNSGRIIFTFLSRTSINQLEESDYYRQATLYVQVGRIKFEILCRQHNVSDNDWDNGGEISWPWPDL